VPLEYRSAGAPPPSWYIHDLMAFHEQAYYVGLLSAAALHGAAHHQPQEFQVVTDKALRPANAGRGRLHFFLKRRLSGTPVQEVKTPTGTMRVSTPEITALDLVRYTAGAGHLGNVATVLAELAEKLDPKRLVEVAAIDMELSVVQRLGYLLDLVGADATTAPLANWLASGPRHLVPLRSDLTTDGALKDARWQVLVNEVVEVET
jgi:predicted transcriptional regulator of viral defense system